MAQPNSIDIFFSCSFREEDSPANDLVSGVLRGLGMNCINVGAGFSSIPPEQARNYIIKSIGLVAVATQRERLGSSDYAMPAAVREEIAIAFGIGKPILIIGEEGVRFDGFMNNYGTRLMFTRNDLSNPRFIEKLVFSVNNFKQELAASSDVSAQLFPTEYYAETIRNLLALEFDQDDRPVWINSLTKRLRFESPLQREIMTRVWPSLPLRVSPDAEAGEWQIKLLRGSRDFEISSTVRMLTADRLELSLQIHPDPQPGDFIEFTRIFRSRYMNPLSQRDLGSVFPPTPIKINGREYFANDGFVTVERTQSLHLHFSFPESYGVGPEDVAIFVASHSADIDYLTPWESKRITSEIQPFGSHLIADVRVDNPLPRHVYGLAWILPEGR